MSRYHWSCDMHDDCFALDCYGRCRALDDTVFKGDCPFYKTQAQYDREQEIYNKSKGDDYEY